MAADEILALEAADPRASATSIELRLYRALDVMGIPYEPQRMFGNYTVDAYLPTLRIALESDGCNFHACPACGYADGGLADSARVIHARAKRRDERLHRIHHITVLHIWSHNMRTDEEALAVVWRMVAPLLNERNLVDDYETLR
jgi:G:T-mismatch repair DNA endonuclease (very short patch repair protein)